MAIAVVTDGLHFFNALASLSYIHTYIRTFIGTYIRTYIPYIHSYVHTYHT